MLPVLLVHGIWNSGRQFMRLASALEQAGVASLTAVDLEPNTGHAGIAELAAQIELAANQLLQRTESQKLDVVGFSMGALVLRYWIQRLNGRQKVRRFVSISGPHEGTRLAYLSTLRGARDMRPNSALLRELAGDPSAWREVELHCLWTRFDLMILPSSGSVIAGASSSRTFPVLLHRWMIRDPSVIDSVIRILTRIGE